MEVFNKLKSTVANLSTVLPGNPVTREYEIGRQIGSAGPGLGWKIYAASKRSTKQEASVFVLDKKSLDKYQKHIKDRILENFKKGISQLTRLRHPSILTVQHPLEESRDSLAFAAEPILSSLANVLGHYENLPIPPPQELEDYQVFDVEIKYGLFQIAEGISFLHNDVKMLHRNLYPGSVIINKSGAWKIFGFDFSASALNPQEKQVVFPSLELEEDLPPICYPNLEHVAPEYVIMHNSTTSSDIFSLGAMIFTIYNKGEPLYNCNAIPSAIKSRSEKLRQLAPSMLSCVPTDAIEQVKLMLNLTPEVRPDSHQFSKLQFFNDVGVKTLQFLDSLYQLNNLQKSQFFKGLPQVLAQMPKRVSLNRVLPSLIKEFVNPEMIPFVLPNVLLIAEQITTQEFQSHILPNLIPVFKLQEPIQILLIFMQKMELLLTKCGPNEIRNNILPMVNCALESDTQQIQELCLSVIPSFANLIDYPSMKNSVLPRIKKICLTTNYLSVRVNTLLCLGKLLEHLDKWLVLDEILPMLTLIPSKEPAVLMGILGIYKLAMDHKKLGITKDIMATRVIPFLMPLSVESGLTLNQFSALINLVKEMVNRVEMEQISKLEQINSMRQEQRSTIDMTRITAMKPNEIIPNIAQESQNSNINDMFSSLGLGSFLSQPASTLEAFYPGTASGSIVQSTKKFQGESLTLEEKQRLAQTQDYQHQLKTQPNILKPAVFTAEKTKPEIKDLTSTLMKSSLTNLNMSNSASSPVFQSFQSASDTNIGTASSPVQASNMFQTAPIFPAVGNFPAPSTFQNSSTFQTPYTFQTPPRFQTSWGVQGNIPRMNMTLNGSRGTLQTSKPSITAFDTLLDDLKRPTALTMTSYTTPIPPPPVSLASVVPKLAHSETSYKDLKDLLG